MKKLLIAFIALLILCVALTGCSRTIIETDNNAIETESGSMFLKVEDGDGYFVVYHKETKVMYTISTGTYNLGNFTVLVNADGSPMLWEG